ncbi:ATP-binding cassette domain-containing protein [Lapidilactobacillus luobeiensis]|uniref:ATP-binding cassette domain-containing protein n=1 Tax=Lapidilactobacillus luobeiensis TaxID=2950371 RepID=UPI0021C36EE2|nr:ABC transporter ATP-binding protein [Lapidilactobacillus luobeiensis]
MSLWKCIKRQRRLSLITLFWQIVGAGCTTMYGLGSANIVTNIVKLNLRAVILWLVVLELTNIVWGWQIVANETSMERWVQAMDQDIRQQIVVNLSRLPYADYHQQDQATYLSWVTNDINTINDYGFETLALVVSQGLTIVMSIGAIIQFHYSLIITIALLLAVMLTAPRVFTKKMNAAALKSSHSAEQLTKSFTDLFGGFDELMQLNRQKAAVKFTKGATTNFATSKIAQARTSGRMMGASNFISLTSQVIVMAHACALFFAKLVPVGAISGARYFSATIFANLTGLMANLVEMKTVEPIFAKYTQVTASPHISTTTAAPAQLAPATVSLEDVTFTYDDKPILQDFSYTFTAQQKYAVIGPSGVGKSTLLNLLAGRLIPTTGTVTLAGHDYQQLPAPQVREQIVYLSQQPHIFSATLGFNIMLDAPEDPERLQAALHFSGLDQMPQVFPAGLATEIIQSGQQLSGGQRERIALARGFYQQRKIWLVDEATASLDPQAATAIETALLQLSDVTLIVVSHHFANPDFITSVDGVLDFNQ